MRIPVHFPFTRRHLTLGGRAFKSLATLAAFTGTMLGILAAFDAPPFDKTPRDPLSIAAAKLRQAGSSELDITTVIRETKSRKTIAFQLRGSVDYRHERGRLRRSDGLEEILSAPYLYVQPAGAATWCRYDLSTLGQGFLFGAVTGFQSNPAAALTNLNQNGSYHEVDEQVLFGVRTVHYQGFVDLFRLSRRTSASVRALLSPVEQSNPTMQLPVEVWLSSDKVVRRIATRFAAGTEHLDASFDFSNFGIAVTVQRPSAANTADPSQGDCPKVF